MPLLSKHTAMTPTPNTIFDRQLVTRHRSRSAASFPSHTYLKDRVSCDLAKRLSYIRRTFHKALDLGCHTGQLAHVLKDILAKDLICSDLSEAMVSQASSPYKIVLDEEYLPFAHESLDLVMSALSLHWVNDLPGVLKQIWNCLQPDGLFLASIFGQDTLIELRDCLCTAEMELFGGTSPRLSPMISIQDAGALLQRAGFALPVVDIDHIQVTYSHPLALFHDLRYMGETNALHSRSYRFTRPLLRRTIELYQKRYSGLNNHIHATFDIITLTGWKPHESQQKPLARGTSKTSLEEIFQY